MLRLHACVGKVFAVMNTLALSVLRFAYTARAVFRRTVRNWDRVEECGCISALSTISEC